MSNPEFKVTFPVKIKFRVTKQRGVWKPLCQAGSHFTRAASISSHSSLYISKRISMQVLED